MLLNQGATPGTLGTWQGIGEVKIIWCIFLTFSYFSQFSYWNEQGYNMEQNAKSTWFHKITWNIKEIGPCTSLLRACLEYKGFQLFGGKVSKHRASRMGFPFFYTVSHKGFGITFKYGFSFCLFSSFFVFCYLLKLEINHGRPWKWVHITDQDSVPELWNSIHQNLSLSPTNVRQEAIPVLPK